MISGATPAIESLRFLRATVGVLVLVTLWAVSRLWRPAPPQKVPAKDVDVKAVKALRNL